MSIFKKLAAAVVQPEEHTIRFFGTKWNSRFSVQWLKGSKLGKRGLYFHQGYAEIFIGKIKIRYRDGK